MGLRCFLYALPQNKDTKHKPVSGGNISCSRLESCLNRNVEITANNYTQTGLLSKEEFHREMWLNI
jgi:hypothetical protein